MEIIPYPLKKEMGDLKCFDHEDNLTYVLPWSERFGFTQS